MITKQNFKELLKYLNFSENNHIFSKNIDGSELKVDFDNEKLIYPAGLIADRDITKNFTKRDLCKISFPPTTETQKQVFGCFLPQSLLILPKYPLNPPWIPD